MTNLPPSRRNFGIMFQSYALFPNLTAFENVAYGLKNKKMKARDIDERVDRLFEMIHLSQAKNRLPAQMSGGEQQRVSIGRALMNDPALLLADEPTGNLDSVTSMEVVGLLKSCAARFHQTTLIVTHQEEVAQMADRVIRMSDGKIYTRDCNNC